MSKAAVPPTPSLKLPVVCPFRRAVQLELTAGESVMGNHHHFKMSRLSQGEFV